jgi:hypothetical protein
LLGAAAGVDAAAADESLYSSLKPSKTGEWIGLKGAATSC